MRGHVEALERREILSSSFPSLVGGWGGQAYPSNISLYLDVWHQDGGQISGVTSLSGSLIPGNFHGTVNKKGVLRLTESRTFYYEIGGKKQWFPGARVRAQVTAGVMTGTGSIGAFTLTFGEFPA